MRYIEAPKLKMLCYDGGDCIIPLDLDNPVICDEYGQIDYEHEVNRLIEMRTEKIKDSWDI
jgi:hypothetical protein